jgi:molybdenum cofactor cytidylyltransferase
MKFGNFPLANAEGLILAHSIRLPGQAFKKGRVLNAEDIQLLTEAGVEQVSGARVEAMDMPEDEAAETLARTVIGEGLELGRAFTGRCNIFAKERGLAIVDVPSVDAINLLDESLTLGTVPPFELVEPKQMVATVKVIPFSAPRGVVQSAVALAMQDAPVLRIATFKQHRVGLIQTRLSGTRESVLDSTTAVVGARLRGVGNALASEIRCHHHPAQVSDALQQLLDEGCDFVLITGASAIVDRRDVLPAAILATGGRIEHFGMPVDPGNLLLLAHHGDVPVLGLPGCARSPKLNGFDWVLRRLFAGVSVTRHDIMRMGAGGLLMEIPSRPLPRAKASPKKSTEPVAASQAGETHVAAIVLAAGQSRRMGDTNKLLAEVDGVPMVVRVVDAAIASRAEPVVVVTGFEAERVRAALKGRDVIFVDNPDFAIGMSTSVRAALLALPDGVGDMPRMSAPLIDELIEAFNPLEGRSIVVPTYKGKRGNPVLWSAQYFAEMGALQGDVGARHLIGEHADAVHEVAGQDSAATIDVDTPEALRALSGTG